ncbi:MAG: dTDP-4-dehydrorhamnose 3,5-epimerase family protein [Gallionella sp.]|nr:dTDP-4-dehydrorhamnose 3,5-epimerase family protein [Gallionella sp.]
MIAIPTTIPDLLIIEPKVFGDDRCIRWGDPALAIDWQLQAAPALSGKDAQGKLFKDAEQFA